MTDPTFHLSFDRDLAHWVLKLAARGESTTLRGDLLRLRGRAAEWCLTHKASFSSIAGELDTAEEVERLEARSCVIKHEASKHVDEIQGAMRGLRASGVFGGL